MGYKYSAIARILDSIEDIPLIDVMMKLLADEFKEPMEPQLICIPRP
jgi:hypothetical protein